MREKSKKTSPFVEIRITTLRDDGIANIRILTNRPLDF